MNFIKGLFEGNPIETIKGLDSRTRKLVLGVGLLFAAASVIISQTDLPTWLFTLAIVLLFVIGLILTILGLRPETDGPPDDEAWARFKEWGMVDLLRLQGVRSMRTLLERCSEKVTILKTWFPEDGEIAAGLAKAFQNHAKVRLIMCHPEAPILGMRSESARVRHDQAAVWIDQGLDVVEDNAIPKTFNGIGFYNAWPGCPVIWADDRIFVGFYFRGHTSPNQPWVEVKAGTPLSETLGYQRDTLWDKAHQLKTLDELRQWRKNRPPPPLAEGQA